MRFLCLHGKGTNGKIFEMQTSRIRRQLGGSHEYVFVDGTVPQQAAPEEVSSPGDQFLSFARDDDAVGAQRLYGNLSAFVEAEGPFQGIMGFSEGAAVAASLLAAQERLLKDGLRSPFAFTCGIFFSAMVPLDVHSLENQNELRRLDPSMDGCVLTLPTTHIWSAADTLYPGAGVVVRDLSMQEAREEYVHGLGHSIPGTHSNEGVNEVTRAIRRTVERAMDIITQD